ncbi:unnamed protein product [Moneuplotes crassus]|uniref:Uncharacterized protein n=1 Tax=Euplotes crassus TaxID=5936 RepID=A0AAD1XVR2_EUPCR|nr:unnamed protein product [Moneuplotes crassus]
MSNKQMKPEYESGEHLQGEGNIKCIRPSCFSYRGYSERKRDSGESVANFKSNSHDYSKVKRCRYTNCLFSSKSIHSSKSSNRLLPYLFETGVFKDGPKRSLSVGDLSDKGQRTNLSMKSKEDNKEKYEESKGESPNPIMIKYQEEPSSKQDKKLKNSINAANGLIAAWKATIAQANDIVLGPPPINPEALAEANRLHSMAGNLLQHLNQTSQVINDHQRKI